MGEGREIFPALSLSSLLSKEESQHFSRGVWALRIRISAVWAAAGPGMAASVNEPLLNHHRTGFIPGHRAGVRTGWVPRFRVLDALVSPFRVDHVCRVRRMDDVVRIPMEDDGENARTFV